VADPHHSTPISIAYRIKLPLVHSELPKKYSEVIPTFKKWINFC